MKLKLNSPILDIAERFSTSTATVHNIVITHIFALHEVFFEGMIHSKMPSLLKCKSSMPASFGNFSCCRLVIDATEVTQDVPGQAMNAQSQTYSSYKNRQTVTSVTGVAPNGAAVYVSKLYPGSTSDVAIVEHSNMLAQLSPGDMVLADKGFTIHPLLPSGVHLNKRTKVSTHQLRFICVGRSLGLEYTLKELTRGSRISKFFHTFLINFDISAQRFSGVLNAG